MPNYWLCVTTDENWEICLSNKIWGTTDFFEKSIKSVQLNDVLIIYLKGFRLAGSCIVTKTYFFSEEQKWEDRIYPHRISFEPDVVLDKPRNIKNDYYAHFTAKPAGYFRTSIRKIPQEEAELLLQFITGLIPDKIRSRYTFQLTKEDFEACKQSTSVNYIQPVYRKFKDQLQPQLLNALGETIKDFHTTDRHPSPYVARPYTRYGGGRYRGNMWLGMAHNKYDDPRNGVQFQFGIRENSIYYYGIWIEGDSYARNARNNAVDVILNNNDRFIVMVKQLSDNYKIHLLNSEEKLMYKILVKMIFRL